MAFDYFNGLHEEIIRIVTHDMYKPLPDKPDAKKPKRFLWTGRTVHWQGHEVVVIDRLNRDWAIIAYKSNWQIMRTVHRKELY